MGIFPKESYLLEVSRYIVLNPVRAKIVKKPDEWKRSSYKSIAGKERAEKFLTIDWILGQFGNDRKAAQREYCEFVREGMGQESIWKELKGRSFLGENKFAEKFLRHIKRNDQIKEVPKKQRYIGRPELDVLFKNIEARQQRNKKIVEAVERYGYSQIEVAGYLKMHYSTISRLMKG